MHEWVTGVDPVSGLPYAANDPENQLWVHLTTWHSLLYCYERYGPGCQLAAELQDLDPTAVPGSRAEVRAYFAAVQPGMCVSAGARAAPLRYPASSAPWAGSTAPGSSTTLSCR